MIDTQRLGEQAAKCMEELDATEDLDEGEVVGVAIIVVAQNKEGTRSFTRAYMSDSIYYQQMGLMVAGAECVREGNRS